MTIAPRSAGEAPGPRALPRVGNLPSFLRDKLGFLSRCAAKYGDVVRLEIGARTYLVTNPDDVRHVLLSNVDNYAKSPRLTGVRARRFFGNGIATAAGAEHLRMRRMLQPIFHHDVIQRFAELIIRTGAEMLAAWGDRSVVELRAEMLTLTQRINLRMLLGEDSEAEIARFARGVTVRRQYQEYLLGSVFPFPEYVPNRTTRAYRRASRDIDDILATAVERRRHATAGPGDVLSMLVNARYDDGSAMPDRLIRDEARTLSIAGYETLAEALTWAWYLLATAPDAADRIAAEATAVSNGGLEEAADVSRLTYTRMVLAEAMRLYPPSWIFVRVARKPDVLASGIRVPAGAKIYLCPWITHRDPRFFEDPTRFEPLRFTEAAIRARPRLSYFPFGAGRRLCIGEDLTWMEGVLLLAQMARRFRVTLVPGQAIVPDPNVTLRARHGLRVRVSPR